MGNYVSVIGGRVVVGGCCPGITLSPGARISWLFGVARYRGTVERVWDNGKVTARSDDGIEWQLNPAHMVVAVVD